MDWFGRSRRRKEFVTSRRHPAFALIALFAVFLQAFVVQTHVHAPGSVAVVGHELNGATASGDSAPHVSAIDSDQVSAVLCQVLTAAGAATVPNPSVTALAERPADTAITALTLAPQLHTHSWQSRAPPTLL
jgi:hypothetical protein